MNKLAIATASTAGLGTLVLVAALIVDTESPGSAPLGPPSTSATATARRPPATTSAPPPRAPSPQAPTERPTPIRPPSAAASPGLSTGSGGPTAVGVVTVLGGGGGAPAVALDAYFSGVDSGNYTRAYQQLTPAERRRVGSQAAYAENLLSTSDDHIVLQSLSGDAARTSADVSFTSHQDASKGPGGQTCTQWSVTYDLIPGSCTGNVCIDRVHTTGHDPC